MIICLVNAYCKHLRKKHNLCNDLFIILAFSHCALLYFAHTTEEVVSGKVFRNLRVVVSAGRRRMNEKVLRTV